jgi:hypothetical protein
MSENDHRYRDASKGRYGVIAVGDYAHRASVSALALRYRCDHIEPLDAKLLPEFTHPPQDARDGASRHAHPRSLDAEPVGFGASGAWWSSKPAHANGVLLIFNLAGMGSDHPVNSRYRGLRDAPGRREPWRAAIHCRRGTRPGPRRRRSPASPPSALPPPSCG